MIESLSQLAFARRLEQSADDRSVPLCVDLDGTLIRTDTLHESLLALLSNKPLMIFVLPFWLFLGRARFKSKVAEAANLDPATLPYRKFFLSFLRKERAAGRSIILVTAAHRRIAGAVANYLGYFSDVIATDDNENLKGIRKARELCDRYGAGNFDYAGDSKADVAVWRVARRSIMVGPSHHLLKHKMWNSQTAHVFDPRRRHIRPYIQAIRVHQWTKNILVFVPLAASHRFTDFHLVVAAYVVFVSFSLVASAGYVFNDLMDLAADRAHPRKRRRPFAAGRIPPSHGILMITGLLIAGFGMAAILSAAVVVALAAYLAITLTYSFWLKRKVLVDVFVLAELYTHRILTGAIATAIAPSYWLLAFSTFFFLSLAMLKRYAELVDRRAAKQDTARGRGYFLTDIETLVSLGTASGYVSVLVFALYINSENVQTLYHAPGLIWLVCPLLLYWISRTWVGAARGKVHDDPLVFAVRDKVSRYILLVCVCIMAVASVVTLPCMPWSCIAP